MNLGCENPPHGFLEEKCGRIFLCFRSRFLRLLD
nr:MAG TPA: hypothetical protein [Caudoviricetes sp.]